MRKTVASIVAGIGLLLSSGCVMVIGVRDYEDRDLVEVNGEMYRIDDETGKAYKVDCPSKKRDDTHEPDAGGK